MAGRHALRSRLERRRSRQGILSGWVGVVVRLFPIFFICLGAWLLIEAVNFRQVAFPGEGTVIELIRDTSGDGIAYTPVIEYQSIEGGTYQGQTHISSSNYSYRIGDRVRILYSLDDPDEVRIDDFFSLYGLGLIFAGVGTVFLLILGFVRSRLSRPVIARSELERRESEARARWAEEDRARSTDPSRYGHKHKPKPPHEPTVRRMR